MWHDSQPRDSIPGTLVAPAGLCRNSHTNTYIKTFLKRSYENTSSVMQSANSRLRTNFSFWKQDVDLNDTADVTTVHRRRQDPSYTQVDPPSVPNSLRIRGTSGADLLYDCR